MHKTLLSLIRCQGSFLSGRRKTLHPEPSAFSPVDQRLLRLSPEEKDALYRYTSGTWIYNREIQLSQRHLHFNVEALADVAARSIGAEKCTDFVKLGEGTSNRAFLLTFDTGRVAVARLPFPIAGPPHLTTASEVATMEYARLHLGLPVPPILSWCSHADQTDVGSEYIIMERVPGIELHHRWFDPDVGGRSLGNTIKDYVLMEKRLAETPFSQIGSLYFVEDVGDDLKCRRLYASGFPDDAASQRFRIGPSVDRRFWRGKRSLLNIDRGPWKDTAAYLHAVVECEIAWLTRFAEPHPPQSPRFRRGESNSPAAHISLLRRFAQLIPYVIPPPHLCVPVLWHPDLHASNVFLTTSGAPAITGIMDWQTAVVQPLVAQAGVPDFLRYDDGQFVDVEPDYRGSVPRLPDNFAELDEESQLQARRELKAAARFKGYTMFTHDHNPAVFMARTYPDATLFNVPLYTASRTWDEGMALFRKYMMAICEAWPRLGPCGMSCPVVFTEREREEHGYELRRWALDHELSSFHVKIGVEEEGGVPFRKYDAAKEMNSLVLQEILAGKIPLESLPGELHETEVEEIRRVWPFQDGALSLTAEPCR